jgi:hypothetical protein
MIMDPEGLSKKCITIRKCQLLWSHSEKQDIPRTFYLYHMADCRDKFDAEIVLMFTLCDSLSPNT